MSYLFDTLPICIEYVFKLHTTRNMRIYLALGPHRFEAWKRNFLWGKQGLCDPAVVQKENEDFLYILQKSTFLKIYIKMKTLQE